MNTLFTLYFPSFLSTIYLLHSLSSIHTWLPLYLFPISRPFQSKSALSSVTLSDRNKKVSSIISSLSYCYITHFKSLVGEGLSGVLTAAATVNSLVGHAVRLSMGGALIGECPGQLSRGSTIIHDAGVDGVLVLGVSASVHAQILVIRWKFQKFSWFAEINTKILVCSLPEERCWWAGYQNHQGG